MIYIHRRFFTSGSAVKKASVILCDTKLNFLSNKPVDVLLENVKETLGLLNFKGKLGEVALIPDRNGQLSAVSGIGDDTSSASQRDAAANASRRLQQAGVDEIVFDPTNNVHCLSEGAVLGMFKYIELKSGAKVPMPKLLLRSDDTQQLKSFQRGLIYGQSQNLARKLMETPANILTPKMFSEESLGLFHETESLRLKAHDQHWVKMQNMNAFLAVAKGSNEPLQFIEIHYKGGSHDGVDVALVGKGITFDSGGISIKPSANMAMMKGDMGGAAVALATLWGCVQLKLPVNLSSFIPLCENMPSGSATKPGDVVFAKNGKSIEIDNTDAEGRLILADALYYAQNTYRPKHIIDIATLTGAMDVALGSAFTGIFVNNDELSEKLMKASVTSGDRFWRMPLGDVYRQQIKSHVADLKNVGGRSAGSCTAAVFLEEFLTDEKSKEQPVSWAHLDIAGVMHSDATNGHLVKGMSGRPVRSLLEFIRSY